MLLDRSETPRDPVLRMLLVVKHSDVIETSSNPDARSIERCGRINRTNLAKQNPDKTPRFRSLAQGFVKINILEQAFVDSQRQFVARS